MKRFLAAPCRVGAYIYLLLTLAVSAICVADEPGTDDVTFEIKGFAVEGNTLLSTDQLKNVLIPFVGPKKTAQDVEKGRDALERLYHEAGYPTVLVNIPEQSVEQGVVRLQVVESKVRRVRVTGNRYFTMEKILNDLPSFAPGEILYIPRVQEELNQVNRSRDLKVSPLLIPGKELGTIDVELKVEDRLPLHGSLELNNRATHDTTDLRLNASVSYDNLWQKDHSVSLQYQTSPEKTKEVEALAFSYVLPSPLEHNHILALYAIRSDSETAFGSGFNVVGKGTIVGGRYVIPLPPKDRYGHNLTVGLDYKDFDEDLGMGTGEALYTPITYLPFSFSYSSSLPDATGVTQFSAGLNMAFRSLVTDQREFEIKRFKATGNYLYLTAGVERNQKLPFNLGLFVKLDGQIASQPLISNEQYVAGGMESVRGYKENEEAGDDAIHGTVELSGPDLGDLFKIRDFFTLTPYLFYDVAALRVQDPLPGEDGNATIQGTGAGVRGTIWKGFEYEAAWAIPLENSNRIDSGDWRTYFVVKYSF